jgi:membrane protein required for colicin V production
MRGFFMEIASLAGIILGIFLAYHFHPELTQRLKPHLPDFRFLPLISFAVLFLGVLIACNLSGWLIKTFLKKTSLGWMDRLLGAGLAVTKGIIILYLFIILASFFLPQNRSSLLSGSKMTPLVISSYQSIVSLISPRHYQQWKKKFLETNKDREKTMPPKSGAKVG